MNKEERDKIADLGVNLSEIIQSIVNSDSGGVLNTYKAHKYGRLLNDFIDKNLKYKETLGDPNISAEDKQRVLNDVVNTFLTSRGYAGAPIEILIGDESLSARGKVVISKEKLNGLSFLEDLGHELGHLVPYDNGKEDTAKIVEGKLGTLEETDTQGKYDDYLESLKKDYGNLKTEEETKEWLSTVPENEKERFIPLITDLIFSSQTVGDPDIVEAEKLENKNGQLYYNGNKVIVLDEMKDGKVVVTPIPKDFIVEQIEGAVLGEAAGALLKIGGKYVLTTAAGKYVVSKSGKVIGKLSDLVKSTSKEITEETTEKVIKKETGNVVEHIVKEQSEKGFKEIVSDKNLLKESIDSGKIKEFYNKKWSAEELKMLPSSNTSSIKELSGTADDAYNFFKNQVEPSSIYKTEKGVLVGKNKEGIYFSYRAQSSIHLSDGVPSIEVSGIKGIRKIEFISKGVQK